MAPAREPVPVIASEAKQSSATKEEWIASSQELLAMTELAIVNHLKIIPRQPPA
jgi:hypothetical protein